MARHISIVRNDFPSSRDGWDADAVRAHLADVEAMVAELRAAAGGAGPATAADTAGAQVREIVAAAERTADAIRAGAEQEARRIREAAAAEAEAARDAVRPVAERARELERQLGEMAAALREQQSPAAAPAPAAPTTAAAPASPTERTDEEAARLVALDLALAGRTREEVDRHLAEHYDVPDRNLVVQDVFSIVEG